MMLLRFAANRFTVRDSHRYNLKQISQCVSSNSNPDSDLDSELDSKTTETNTKLKSGWRTISNWETLQENDRNNFLPSTSTVADYSDLTPTFSNSPVEKCIVRDRIIYLKRDDLLRLPNSNISGNKARKLFSLNSLPISSFPKVIVSYGGPQSNAMLALAAIVHSKNIQLQQLQKNVDSQVTQKHFQFLYYTKKLPRWLRKTPSGNFLRATSLGMQIVELSPTNYTEVFGGEHGGSIQPPSNIELPSWAYGDAFWVPQGGATGIAIQGVNNLANEIYSFWTSQIQSTSSLQSQIKSSSEKTPTFQRKLAICVPGGTCTTVLFLQRRIAQQNQQNQQKHDIIVVAIPIVGDSEYAKRQMIALDLATGGDGKSCLPYVLEPSSKTRQYPKRLYFGEPHSAILSTYFEMKDDYNIFLDLLYGAPAWTLLLQHWNGKGESPNYSKDPDSQSSSPLAGREIMYVHSGGLEGNASQMTRYKQKGLVSKEQTM